MLFQALGFRPWCPPSSRPWCGAPCRPPMRRSIVTPRVERRRDSNAPNGAKSEPVAISPNAIRLNRTRTIDSPVPAPLRRISPHRRDRHRPNPISGGSATDQNMQRVMISTTAAGLACPSTSTVCLRKRLAVSSETFSVSSSSERTRIRLPGRTAPRNRTLLSP